MNDRYIMLVFSLLLVIPVVTRSETIINTAVHHTKEMVQKPVAPAQVQTKRELPLSIQKRIASDRANKSKVNQTRSPASGIINIPSLKRIHHQVKRNDIPWEINRPGNDDSFNRQNRNTNQATVLQKRYSDVRKNLRRVPVQNFVVADPGDDSDSDLNDGVYDPPTLRSAIENANQTAGADLITFASGISEISLSSGLPAITQPVTITGIDSAWVTINGNSHQLTGIPVFTDDCVIKWLEVTACNGSGIFLGGDNNTVENCIVRNIEGPGINFNGAQNNFIRSNKIYGNTGSGGNGITLLQGSDNNYIDNNFIGTADGETASPNSRNGIIVETAQNEIFGNVISGNAWDGILLDDPEANGNRIEFNYIGITADGDSALGNGANGINIREGAQDSILGNLISGNEERGIGMSDPVQNVLVDGNFIGTDTYGEYALGNGYSGVSTSGQNILIQYNLISGGQSSGIQLGWDARNCEIKSNYIGTDYYGTEAVGNASAGIYIAGAQDNVIGGLPEDMNLISGNSGAGVYMNYSNSSNNLVANNYIGVDTSGTRSIANWNGVAIDWGTENIIRDNLISGNLNSGVYLYGYTAKNNLVNRNKIGTDRSSHEQLGNESSGIIIENAPENIIGEPGSEFSNLISGNWNGDGITIFGDSAYANIVQNNLIGTDLSGAAALLNGYSGVYIFNAEHNMIGMAVENGGNVISGNYHNGVVLDSARSNTIQNNFIGTDLNALEALPNGYSGVYLRIESRDNTIGGVQDDAGNIISGNAYSGVTIDSSCALNRVLGNTIGLDITGTTAIGNNAGIAIVKSDSNQIGGLTESARNTISGNYREGIYISGKKAVQNEILGNFIGTSAFGDAAVGNIAQGILLSNTCNNIIGRAEPNSGNLISGNLDHGISLSKSDSNRIQGNVIGLNFLQTASIGNSFSGIQLDTSCHSLIGGDSDNAGNIIAGNEEDGIAFLAYSDSNKVFSNFIGSDSTGEHAFPNGQDGISFRDAVHNSVGDSAKGNHIAYNTNNGINVIGGIENAFRANSIFENGALGIDLANDGVSINDTTEMDADLGPNQKQNYPRLTTAYHGTELTVNGILQSLANTEFRIDFYSNDSCNASGYGEGESFLGSDRVTTGDDGEIVFTTVLPPVAPGKFITATATDADGNTSEFSRCNEVIIIGPAADLAISIEASRDTVVQGDSLSYFMTVINSGPSEASNVVVADTLPVAVRYGSSFTARGTISILNQLFTCTIDSMASADTVHMGVTVSADSAQNVRNVTQVHAQQPDVAPQNNRAETTVVIQTPTGSTDQQAASLPEAFSLSQNYPNPFNPITKIRYGIPEEANVLIQLFTIDGRMVATLVNTKKLAGNYSIDLNGAQLSSGIYFYRMSAGNYRETKRMILLK